MCLPTKNAVIQNQLAALSLASAVPARDQGHQTADADTHIPLVSVPILGGLMTVEKATAWAL